ncbi:hypothetical protein KIH87_16280 [Paraneptunicella aestuarii]|uniref:hypothetical protein n=1 Tax=Paraneptunicella aestuarii TaxID=2831148 RepID=UPI001E556979|nr:hypothetical protein [Paraneptunicella aestuarii]UAA38229.1 hypothetical protein KIH87_16280 [Paraneptunicella aestuarii]
MIKYFLYVVIASIAFGFAYRGEHQLVDLVYIASCGLVIVSNFRYVNVVSLATILMFTKLFELVLYENLFLYFNAYGLYFSYVLIDLFVMILIYFRVPITRGIHESMGWHMDEDEWFTTNTDLLLALMQMLHLLIGVLMLIEHLLRNLDDIYIPSFFKLFLSSEFVDGITCWLASNCRLIYDNYVFMVLTVTGLEFLILLFPAGVYPIEKRLMNS